MSTLPDRRSTGLLPRLIALTITLLLSAGAVLLTLAWLGNARPARADTLCVKPSGGDGCQASISAALALASEGNVIQVAAGTYTENVLISQTVTLQGGWSSDFSLRDTTAFSSTIFPADNTQSVVAIEGQFGDPAAVAPTLDGFVISGGRADLGSNHGGGLRIRDSNALVISNTIRDNRAFLLGGGVWVQRGAPILQSNHILNNQSTGGGFGGLGRGGGVQLENSASVVISNTIAGNLATGLSAYGGGIDITGASGGGVSLISNTIRLNTADGEPAQQTLGGGISIAAGAAGQVALTGNIIISNSAVVEANDLGLGGGIAIASGQVRLENGLLISNTATSGGGLYIGGGLAACCSIGGQDNLFQANRAGQGGGMYLDGQAATLRGGLFISNTATAGGGGLLISAGGMISLTNSAVIANLAGTDGGAILNSGTISLSNVTVSGNNAGGMGGGIANFNLANLSNATISDNASDNGAGVFNNNTVNALNSLIAANTGDNCLGVLSSQGYNLEDGVTCAFGQPTDMPNTPAQINPLEDNGGPTPTHSLAQDSPAIDAGDNAACAARDQRGVPRPLDGDGDGLPVCDIGAFEYQIPSTILITADEPDPSQPGEPFTVIFSVNAGVGVPGGVVTVTVENEPDTCSDTLSGETGSCQLALSTPGTYTLRAAFTSAAGNYLPSQTTTEHTVASIHLYLPVILQNTP